MALVDLTLAIPALASDGQQKVRTEERIIGGKGGPYTGMIYHFNHDGMVGTYLDLPGHIKETDDGLDAASYPLEKLFRVEATVLHLNRVSGSGVVTADELEAACPKPFRGQALVLNALGPRRFDEIESRTVWIGRDARQWMIDHQIHLLVSDIYESLALEGVFLDLFQAEIATVCYPVNLHQLTLPYALLTVLTARYETVTQLPCRILAELID